MSQRVYWLAIENARKMKRAFALADLVATGQVKRDSQGGSRPPSISREIYINGGQNSIGKNAF